MDAIMVELTPEQHLALERSGGNTTRAIDPATNAEYVIVRAELYERIKSIVSDNETWSDDAYQAAADVFAREGWDDPRMDIYDSLDPRRLK
jgi:hypothetical protein